MHAMSCSMLPRFTSHWSFPAQRREETTWCMSPSRANQERKEVTFYCLVLVCEGIVSHLLHSSSGDLDKRWEEDGNWRPGLSTAHSDWKSYGGLEGGLILCLRSLFEQEVCLSHIHKNTQCAQGGLQLMTPQVFTPLSRCGALGYL